MPNRTEAQTSAQWRWGQLLWTSIGASGLPAKIAETFAVRTILVAVGLFTTVLVARALGPEGRGLYAVAHLILTMGVQFGNLGLHTSNTYHVARDRTALAPLVGNSLVVSLAFGGLAFILGGLLVWQWPAQSPLQRGLFFLAIACIPFGLATLLFQNLLLGIQAIRAYNKIELWTKLSTLLLIAIIILANWISVERIFLAVFLGMILSFVWGWMALRPHLESGPVLSLSLFKESFGYGSQIYLIALLSYLVLRSDLFFVQYFMGNSGAGLYSISQNVADLAYLLPGVVGLLLFPKLVEEEEKRARRTLRYSLVTFAVVLLIFLAGRWALPDLIVALFGQAFLEATQPALWLVLAMAFYAVGNIVGGYILAHGKNPLLVWTWLAGAVANIVLNLNWIPRYGLMGAALSTLLVYLGVMISNIFIARRLNRVPERK